MCSLIRNRCSSLNGIRGLQEDVKICLRSCMLHSIPPPPQGVVRLEASLRDNLALCSCSELIAVVVDLARGNAYLGEDIQVNRLVVIESIIPRLAEATSTTPCPQCWYLHTKCQCGGQVLPASYTPSVATPGLCYFIYPSPASPTECCLWRHTNDRVLCPRVEPSVASFRGHLQFAAHESGTPSHSLIKLPTSELSTSGYDLIQLFASGSRD